MPALEIAVGACGLTNLVSPRLSAAGFSHAFSTRLGGVSTGPFTSLNLGRASADGDHDPEERIEENTRRFLASVGLDVRTLIRARQVHGVGILDADRAMEGGVRTDADVLIATSPGRSIAVRTADCVPILLADPSTGAVAAVHAGWRGLVNGTIQAALRELERRGAPAGRLLAAIGPAIGVDAFEVGDEVAAAFLACGLESTIQRGRAKPHIDCHRAAVAILEREGVPRDAIDGEAMCTVESREFCFSYRRDGPQSGRMAAVIAPRTGTTAGRARVPRR